MSPDDVWEDVTVILDLDTPNGKRTASFRAEASTEIMDVLRDGLPGDVRVTDVRFVQ